MNISESDFVEAMKITHEDAPPELYEKLNTVVRRGYFEKLEFLTHPDWELFRGIFIYSGQTIPFNSMYSRDELDDEAIGDLIETLSMYLGVPL